MPSYQTEGLILFKKDIVEDDSLFIIFSRDFGKITVKARGIKKIQSKLAGQMMSFNLVRILIAKGRIYDQITSVNIIKTFPNLKDNLTRLAACYYVSEIIDQLVKEKQSEEELYQTLFCFFELLDKKELKQPLDYLLALFIFKIINHLGYQPQLFFCQICHKKIIPGNNFFSFEFKGLVCSDCQNKSKDKILVSDNTIKILRLINNLNLNELIKIKANHLQTSEIIKLAKILLKNYLDSELKSERFLKIAMENWR